MTCLGGKIISERKEGACSLEFIRFPDLLSHMVEVILNRITNIIIGIDIVNIVVVC